MPVYYLLVIDAPHYCAGSVWKKTGKMWECIEAAPIIRWMVGRDVQSVGNYLKKQGYSWEWIKEDLK
jgi:hypothetical protein